MYLVHMCSSTVLHCICGWLEVHLQFDKNDASVPKCNICPNGPAKDQILQSVVLCLAVKEKTKQTGEVIDLSRRPKNQAQWLRIFTSADIPSPLGLLTCSTVAFHVQEGSGQGRSPYPS